ncbi:type VI secretion system protein TssA [Pseudomonas sp. 2(2015)]|uniref:type VI secretion system protein TssA n=1 Tax=Pseudomonas sp. 2(2015) TaxID=1619950 RepID=UPI0005EB6A3F|nr:type VI secretion system protein TssA [Pseudomonas sp. 2(2015)]KJK16939.1 membrane protein [Pseudomonas sp. 2(2015)]
MSLVIDLPAGALTQLLAPIEADRPAGYFDVEDETFQAIDQEMVKLGGLRENTIDWPYIDEASRQYLATQCKHLRILGHLQVVWLRTAEWGHWSAALTLLAGMVEHYWDSAHPVPGPTGYLNKRKQVLRLLEGLGQALPSLQRSSFAEVHQTDAEQALASLLDGIETTRLEPAAIEALQLQLGKYRERCLPAPAGRAVAADAGLSPAFFASTAPVGNEREQRRALLNMAEQINQQDPYDPVGYQLRRFALWTPVRTAPSVTRERRSELSAVPRDIVDSYHDALAANNVEPALLMRIERSVGASPYWLRGSFLAASVASRLAMDEVAGAIRQACERFACRLPGLTSLCFSDGTPFADAQTLAWISGADQPEAAHSPVQEFAGLRDELIAQLDREGVEVVLLRLQELQAEQQAPRQRCYATVIAADLLAARGLAWLADDLYAGVARVMRETSAQGWEPQLYLKVAQRSGADPLITAVKE